MHASNDKIKLDEERIHAIAKLTDREIVEKLWNGDEDAWGYIYLYSILPTLKREKFYLILNDRKISRLDIYAMVLETMLDKKKLELFEFRCPVIYWIRYYVKKIVYEYCRKNDYPVSPEVIEDAITSKEAPTEFEKDELEFAQKCFATLWRKNPMRAYVHLLKTKNELSARQIHRLLNISSEKNAAKIAERAMNDMRELRKELSVSGGKR